MARKNPTIVYKTRFGEPVDTRRFNTLTGKEGVFEYLRSEGCHFRTSIFNRLGEDSVQLATPDNEYEVESALLDSVQRITRNCDGSFQE